MKRFSILLMIAFVLPLGTMAQSFTYNYRGVDFKCKVKNGKTIIHSFDADAAKVVIPSQVQDKKGTTYQVSVIDLFKEATYYKTNFVVIEPGITEIEEYCFSYFRELSNMYIPNTIERIGKKAFNAKNAPTFTMPSNIVASDLLAGNAVYPRANTEMSTDQMPDIDLSSYIDDPSALASNPKSTEQETIVQAAGVTPGTSDIDYNIPTVNINRENTFCVIIANETYGQKDTPNVKYAAQDGKTFQSYCLRTLGLPKENIHFASNASYLKMKELLGWFQQIAEAFGDEANFIFYYAGHGVPDEKGNCKLIPSDVSINDVNNGFSLKELYSSLGKLTTNSVLVLIDACFSGNDRTDVAALDEMHRGIVREVKKETVTGNVVVLTAASNTETALSYEEKAHGLFSYYLMKKLQDTKGDVTFGELYDYIKREVTRRSVVAKGKKQTPSATWSNHLENNWRNLKF